MGSLFNWSFHAHIAWIGIFLLYTDGDSLMEGKLTNNHNGKVVLRQYSFEMIDGEEDRPKIFQLLEGPTGYESFYMHDFAINAMRKKGWTACSGTKDRWDRLEFSAEEMSKAFDEEAK